MTDAAARWAKERALFEDLLDLDLRERAGRLASTADAELREAVERLLALREGAGTFLDEPPMSLAGELLAGGEPGDALPDRIGPYRVLERLGRGGMGDVFLAERADGQFEQRVAIKLLKPGIDTEGVRRRFLQERQVLARLDHPNIARLSDGGTAGGRPYFVMELVEGEPITEYCRTRRLGLDERLRLIVTCCEAVDAAHRRLVVHRDIKPSNVLVTGDGQVKLLDFGIAKLLSEESDAAQLTQAEERVLTPMYAAPEQILGEPVTTATDVYALGVVLYQLLTGVLPHRRDTGSAAQLASAVEAETIEKPSRAVAGGQSEAAAFPPRETARLSALLSNDLDAIVLKALRREPERRYAGAAALGEDLKRHLAGQRVEARPDTFSYRAGKFVRRHRAGVAAAVLTLAALLAGLAGTTWQARRARTNAARAEASARRAERVQEFLIRLFRASDPSQSRGEKLTARELLADGRRRVEAELAGEPEVRASLFDALAQIYHSLGALPEARTLAEKAVSERRRIFGIGDAQTALSRVTLAEVLSTLGEEKKSEAELQAAIPTLESAYGPDADETIRAKEALADVLVNSGDNDKGLVLARGLIASRQRRFGPQSVEMAGDLRLLGIIQEGASRYDEAEASYRQAIAIFEKTLGNDDPRTAVAHGGLAELLAYRGRRPEAENEFAIALAGQRKSLGPDHPDVASTLLDQGLLFVNERKYPEADAAFLESLRIYRALEAADAANALRLLGVSLLAQERYAEAARRLEDAVSTAHAAFGAQHQITLTALGNLGEAQLRLGQTAAAEATLLETVAGLEEMFGKDADNLRSPLNNLGELRRQQKRFGEAEALHGRALATQLKTVGPDNPAVAGTRLQLALDLVAEGGPENLARARTELDQAIVLARRVDPGHPRIDEMLLASGRLARMQGDRDRARRELTDAAQRLETHHGGVDPRTREARAELGVLAR